MKTKLLALIVLMLLPLGMAAQSDPIEARLKAEYGNDNVKRLGDGTSLEPFWYKVTLNGKVGAYDKYGYVIILPKMSEYDNISYIFNFYAQEEPWRIRKDYYEFIVNRNGKVGIYICDCDPVLAYNLELIPPIYDYIYPYFATPTWYEVELNGKVGACTDTGKRIIPPKYDSVSRYGSVSNTDDPIWYGVKLNGKDGAFDKDGREIIPPSHYDVVFRLGHGTSKEPFWYGAKLNGKYGACDANGKEIIPPVYDNIILYYDDVFEAKINGVYVSLGIGLNPDGTAKGTYTPAPGYGANSDGLLYKGTYTP